MVDDWHDYPRKDGKMDIKNEEWLKFYNHFTDWCRRNDPEAKLTIRERVNVYSHTINELMLALSSRVPQRVRGIGQTTTQIKDAPANSMFVCLPDAYDYVRARAERIGRLHNVTIVRQDQLTWPSWRGRRFSAVIVDHAVSLTEEQQVAVRLLIPQAVGDDVDVCSRAGVLSGVLNTGTSQELDALGDLLDLPRRCFGPIRQEPDIDYRKRLSEHKLVQFMLTYCMGA